jgi:surface antigen
LSERCGAQLPIEFVAWQFDTVCQIISKACADMAGEDMKSALLTLLTLTLLSGCASLGFGGKKPVSDPVTKPAVEPVQPGARLIDRLSGGLIGQKLGQSLSASDRQPALEAEYKALEATKAGQAVAWANPSTGHGGSVIAAQPYRVGSQNCRQYTHTFSMGSPAQSVRGTACRNSDGSWTPLT